MSPRQNITITEDTSWEKLWATQAGGAVRLLKPWASLGLLLGAGEIYHVTLGHPPVVTWAAVGMTLAGTGTTWFGWHTSRLVNTGRLHTAVTIGAVAAWLVISTVVGPLTDPVGWLMMIFGPAVAFSWNLRSSARVKMSADGDAVTPAGRLSGWFADAAKNAGVPGATLKVREIEPTRAVGKVELPPGERTAADLLHRARNVESGMKFPPNSLSIAEDPDRADHAILTLSDPRMINEPVPWPGPSLPGESIAKPLRTGIWQDGVPVQHTITGHHVHVMGASGSGKSEGACWCYGAEIITRSDVAVLAADRTKASQTWGPLEPALHRVEYTRDGVRDMLNTLHKLVPQRSEYLGDHGLTKWVPGCGLTYLICWLEETPDIYDALTSKEQDHWLSDVKALRSAGGTWVVSLQRSDWSQLPTIVRGQMASVCFGLYKSSDERFGLSEKQQEMGASPSSWGTDHPGKAYLHYPGTPPDRIAMAMRHYAWGDTSTRERHDETAAAAMAEHAAQYPAAARPVDEMTAAITGGLRTPARPAAGTATAAGGGPARPVAVLTRPADDDGDKGLDDSDYYDEEDAEEMLSEYLHTDDPTPGLEAGIDDEIADDEDDQQFEFDLDDAVTPDEARSLFAEHLEQMRNTGKTEFSAKDFRPIMRPGMGRAWIQARLKERVEAGELLHDPDLRTYTFPRNPGRAA